MLKLIGILGLLLSVTLTGTLTGCSQTTANGAQNVVQTVLTDIQAGCAAEAFVEQIIPAQASDAQLQAVASQVASACNIANQYIPNVQNMLNAFIQAGVKSATSKAPKAPPTK
jgi:hypothetical protein